MLCSFLKKLAGLTRVFTSTNLLKLFLKYLVPHWLPGYNLCCLHYLYLCQGLCNLDTLLLETRTHREPCNHKAFLSNLNTFQVPHSPLLTKTPGAGFCRCCQHYVGKELRLWNLTHSPSIRSKDQHSWGCLIFIKSLPNSFQPNFRNGILHIVRFSFKIESWWTAG